MNGTPENYEYWLSRAIAKTKEEFPDKQRFVFINAWNEWAEGAHLEPDLKYGHQFLEATLRAKGGSAPARWPNAPAGVGVRPGQNDIPKHLQKSLASRTWKQIKTKITKKLA